MVLGLLQRAATYTLGRSVSGALGPALADELERPSPGPGPLPSAHWELMNAVSQLLGLHQQLYLFGDDPLVRCARQLARTSETMNRLWQQSLASYATQAMALDALLHELLELLGAADER